MKTHLTINEDEFFEQFTLIKNHLDPHASFAGNLFETYGEEQTFVSQYSPECIWTVVIGDNEELYILSGWHVVNRFGYLISREPVPNDSEYTVELYNEH